MGEKSRSKEDGKGCEDDSSPTAIVGVKFASEKSPNMSKHPGLNHKNEILSLKNLNLP